MSLQTRGVDPYEAGGHVPQYLWRGGDIHGNVHPDILEVISFRMSTRVTATVVCCILTQILCVVSQKGFSFWETSSQGPLPGLCLWTPLGDFRPRDLQSSFMSPPIILWDRRPCYKPFPVIFFVVTICGIWQESTDSRSDAVSQR